MGIFLVRIFWIGTLGLRKDQPLALNAGYLMVIYIMEYEAGKVGLELDDTAQYLVDRLPDAEARMIRADSARPESVCLFKTKRFATY